MKKIFIYIILIISFISCEKQVEWPLQNEPEDIIIVDGTITSELKEHSIKLTFPVQQLNNTADPVTGATVVINDKDSTYLLTEQPANSGIYVTSSNFAGIPGERYTLLINYKQKIYSAKTILLAGQTSTQLSYTKNNSNGLYHITWVANAYNGERFAMYEILLDWSTVPGYQNTDPDSCKARLLYYTLPTIDVSQVFAPEVENVYFPLGTTITERRYSITREHAEFIRALLSETNWQGGLFDSAHSDLPTNLSDGAAGFFAACGVTSVTFTVTP
jgi:hypothetical protein